MQVSPAFEAQTVPADPSAGVLSRSGRRRAERLGKRVKSVDRTEAKSLARLKVWASKAAAARILKEGDSKLAGRISRCGMVAHGDMVSLQVRETAAGRSASFAGLVSCGSVWACPRCARKKGQERAEELNSALAWARSEGHGVALVTLTARHGRSDRLADLLGRIKRALKFLRQSRAYRALGLVGSVVANEVTHGNNGFHPHFHIIALMPGADLSPLESLRSEWLRCLSRVGLDGNGHAFDVQDGSAAGEYISGWSAGEEVALSDRKAGRGASRSMWEVLADARDGCKRSERIWLEYALASKGRRALVWSPGLKNKVLNAEADAEAVAEPEPEPVTVRMWFGATMCWASARRRRCALLDAAEVGGDLDAAEHGPLDRDRWSDELDGSAMFEAAL